MSQGPIEPIEPIDLMGLFPDLYEMELANMYNISWYDLYFQEEEESRFAAIPYMRINQWIDTIRSKKSSHNLSRKLSPSTRLFREIRKIEGIYFDSDDHTSDVRF